MQDEAKISRAILRWLAAQPNTWFWKQHQDMYSVTGLPDIVGTYRSIFISFEVKRPGGRLTPKQESVQRRIRRAGGICEMVTSVDDVVRIIEELADGISALDGAVEAVTGVVDGGRPWAKVAGRP